MTYRGHIKNGQIMLDDPVDLPEGAEVHVNLIDAAEKQQTVWSKLMDLAGTVKGLPPDLAENHDHYLYGTPKRQ
jgi:hypothetical protein